MKDLSTRIEEILHQLEYTVEEVAWQEAKQDATKDLLALINEIGEEELKQKLTDTYKAVEDDKPPQGFVDRYEKEWNDGFYKGRLKTMEQVVEALTGKSGDELPEPKTKENK